ncbi:hypothetical protein CCH79_00010673 [Gambusia affinis]|uniref:Uncharacterized protein n=1 Tax=Gambusia affinis TaxID=33528 RepID=A0A315W4J0_GAMAF|nr:hypothetical protein CCH79_00010673 [Gambusia affinis]
MEKTPLLSKVQDCGVEKRCCVPVQPCKWQPQHQKLDSVDAILVPYKLQSSQGTQQETSIEKRYSMLVFFKMKKIASTPPGLPLERGVPSFDQWVARSGKSHIRRHTLPTGG